MCLSSQQHLPRFCKHKFITVYSPGYHSFGVNFNAGPIVHHDSLLQTCYNISFSPPTTTLVMQTQAKKQGLWTQKRLMLPMLLCFMMSLCQRDGWKMFVLSAVTINLLGVMWTANFSLEDHHGDTMYGTFLIIAADDNILHYKQL